MRDLWGREVTMEEALLLKKKAPPRDFVTIRRMRMERWLHPCTGLPLLNPLGETCGTCEHHYARSFGGTYHKCALVKASCGPATDIRVGWPACEKWASKASAAPAAPKAFREPR